LGLFFTPEGSEGEFASEANFFHLGKDGEEKRYGDFRAGGLRKRGGEGEAKERGKKFLDREKKTEENFDR
jgi:hypothetical protein